MEIINVGIPLLLGIEAGVLMMLAISKAYEAAKKIKKMKRRLAAEHISVAIIVTVILVPGMAAMFLTEWSIFAAGIFFVITMSTAYAIAIFEKIFEKKEGDDEDIEDI